MFKCQKSRLAEKGILKSAVVVDAGAVGLRNNDWTKSRGQTADMQ